MRVAIGFLLIFVLAWTVAAQERTSTISGVVRDPSGAAVEAAEVRVSRTGTGLHRTVASNASGAYRAASLELGEYEVMVAKAGFRTVAHRGVVVELDRETVVNHTLLLGDRMETVNVSGEARSIEAASSAISSVVDRRTIEELPLNGRDYIQLAALEAGVRVARAQARNGNHGFGLPLSIAGSRPIQNGFWLDGVSVASYQGGTPGSVNGVNLGVDAIGEFSIQTSNYSAQYGRSSGGSIHAATRSGGNDLHGSAFYFHRNDNLDARNFFDGAEPPEFRRHQFGGSLGGPVVRNKTFFFATYEQFRELRGNTAFSTTLSDEARAGRLARGTVAVDPVMARVVDLYPRPNGDVLGDTGLFVFSNDEHGTEHFVSSRLDHNAGDRDKVFLRYTFDDGARTDQTGFALADRRNETRYHSAAMEHTHIFSPQWLNTARLGLLRTFTASGITRARVAGADSAELAFLPGSTTVGYLVVPGLTDFSGGSGSFDSDINAFTSFQYSNDVARVTGRHSLKFGARLERTRFNTDSQNRPAGEFQFNGIAELLTNTPSRFRSQLPGSDTVRGDREWIAAWYVNDTWRVSPRLTLDLGLRHEWDTVPREVNGKVSNLDEVASKQMRLGDPLFDNPSAWNLLPRVGAAWDVTGKGSLIVRGGYGLYADLLLSQFIVISGSRNPPFFLRGDVRGLSRGAFPSAGFPALVNNPRPEWRIERIPRDIGQPLVEQWNVNIEQVLPAGSTLRAAYTGSRGRNLSVLTEDANLVRPVTQSDGRLFYPANGTKVNPVFGHVRDRRFDARSSYHGLQGAVRRRFRQGIQAQFAYTFSKTIDDSSNYFGPNETVTYLPLPLDGPARFNRGLADHDVRHSVTFSGTWDLPSPREGVARAVAGGWQAGTIVTYASGLPFSARLGYDAARTQTSRPDQRSGQRPDLAPGASVNPVTGDPRRWFDPAAFRRPTVGYLGNVGRNTLTGPDSNSVDFAMVRRLRFGEKVSGDLRFEFFNLFNHTNFDLPVPERTVVFNQNGPREDAGRITSAGKSREIQFGLKLRF